ncbi:Sec1-like protein, partial [Kipferlia bialata]
AATLPPSMSYYLSDMLALTNDPNLYSAESSKREHKSLFASFLKDILGADDVDDDDSGRYSLDVAKYCKMIAANSLPENRFPYLSRRDGEFVAINGGWGGRTRKNVYGALTAEGLREAEKKEEMCVREFGHSKKVVIFIVGGATPAELTAMHRASLRNPSLDFYIGSTQLLSASSFVDQLSTITYADPMNRRDDE